MTTQINPLPTPPSPADSPADFNTKAFALLGALPTFVTEANAQAAGLDASVAAAGAQAAIATNKAGEALTSANNAALSKTGADSARDAAVIAKNAAEAALDSFDDRYLGAKAVAPTADNDGNALLTGALYWDTVIQAMRAWNGSAWVTLPAATAATVGNTPAGAITALTVQGALNQLDADKAPKESPAFTGTPTGITKAHVGLANVDNTSAAQLRDRATHTGTQAISTVSGLQAALDGTVKTTGSQTISGDKTFNNSIFGGSILATSGALGYGVGAGGTVVQSMSKSAAVTLNKPTGQITMDNAALAAGGRVTFVCNNSLVASTDTVVLNLGGGSANPDDYLIRARVFSGGFKVSVINQGASGLSEAPVLNFTILKGATS